MADCPEPTHTLLMARAKRETLTKRELGYVETPTAKTCGTCEYFVMRNAGRCTLLKVPVHPSNGCCDGWEE